MPHAHAPTHQTHALRNAAARTTCEKGDRPLEHLVRCQGRAARAGTAGRDTICAPTSTRRKIRDVSRGSADKQRHGTRTRGQAWVIFARDGQSRISALLVISTNPGMICILPFFF